MGEPHLYPVNSEGVVDAPSATPNGSEPSGPSSSSGPKRAPAKARPIFPVPTDRMKFDTQVQALRTICSASRNGEQAVTADDMGNLMGVLPVTAVLNNGFFVSVKLVEKVGRGDYKPTDLALKFQQKWTFNKAEAPKILAPAFVGTWFHDAVKTKIELHDGEASRADLIEVLAGVANTDDSYATQYGFLLDWLEYVGLTVTENGNVRLAPGTQPDAKVETPTSPAAAEEIKTPEASTTTVVEETPPVPPAPVTQQRIGVPIVSLSIDVVLTSEDMQKLSSEQITSLFEGIGKVAAIKDALKQG